MRELGGPGGLWEDKGDAGDVRKCQGESGDSGDLVDLEKTGVGSQETEVGGQERAGKLGDV